MNFTVDMFDMDFGVTENFTRVFALANRYGVYAATLDQSATIFLTPTALLVTFADESLVLVMDSKKPSCPDLNETEPATIKSKLL